MGTDPGGGLWGLNGGRETSGNQEGATVMVQVRAEEAGARVVGVEVGRWGMFQSKFEVEAKGLL